MFELGDKRGKNMKLSHEVLKEKINGCFMGKCIGGTLGAPFECYRGVNNVEFYVQKLNCEPIPNDDLDLQLVWLNAVERNGKNTNADVLAEHWISFVSPNWSEYGAAKNNLKSGIVPSHSGFINNPNRNSCGAFIRSEIWACLAAGNPNISVNYMLQDAMVDHSEEGVYSAVFCAAMQSAAFCENDIKNLIKIGLSYIPEDCAVAKAVKLVMDLHENGVKWKEVRRRLLIEFPATFGMILGYKDTEAELDIPIGEMGYDAPSNIGFIIIGLLYGEGDFGKSICLATNCGEDTDCTAATVGALLGIINGEEKIPQKWKEPIGKKIATQFVNFSDAGCSVPKTVGELTDRIIKVIPEFLGQQYYEFNDNYGYSVICQKNLYMQDIKYNNFYSVNFLDVLKQQPFGIQKSCHLFDVWVDYGQPPYIESGKKYVVSIKMKSNIRQHQWINVKCLIEENSFTLPINNLNFCLEQDHGCVGMGEFELELIAPATLCKERYEAILDITSKGHHTRLFVPLTFLNSPVPQCDEGYLKN